MLSLSRSLGERIILTDLRTDELIIIEITRLTSDRTTIGITADKEKVFILREELFVENNPNRLLPAPVAAKGGVKDANTSPM
jgi:sRNA-binding carbon storage regulator CsrA